MAGRGDDVCRSASMQPEPDKRAVKPFLILRLRLKVATTILLSVVLLARNALPRQSRRHSCS